jgi:carbon-monoxide dehydrogenase medium subunit
MYPRPFRYHRAKSLREASSLLAELGSEARLLAGGQSLIPLMKLRLAGPSDLIDINFIPDLAYVRESGGELRIGALARHSQLESSNAVSRVPILHDCAAGIADVQIRNRGTLGGSLAEADPTGDWAPVLLTLETTLQCVGPHGERSVALSDFITDAFTTVLAPGELVSEVRVKVPNKNSGGAYLAFKRCAPVYATASAAVQLTMKDSTCSDAAISLGAVSLTATRLAEAEAELRGKAISEKTADAAADAAAAACDPQPDMRGSVEYKRSVVRALVRNAIDIAHRRARGERVESSHYYA